MIPDHFWTDACQRSNGFFGCQDTYDEERKLNTHSNDLAIVKTTCLLLTADHSYMVPILGKTGCGR